MLFVGHFLVSHLRLDIVTKYQFGKGLCVLADGRGTVVVRIYTPPYIFTTSHLTHSSILGEHDTRLHLEKVTVEFSISIIATTLRYAKTTLAWPLFLATVAFYHLFMSLYI